MSTWTSMVEIVLVAGIIEILAAAALRFYIKSLPAVTMQKTAVPDAKRIVADYVSGMEETRFGFPTGFFEYSADIPGMGPRFVEKRTASVGWKASAGVIMIPVGIGVMIGGGIGRAFGETDGAGCFGTVIGGGLGLVIGILFLPLVLGATIIEVILKPIATSQIDAEVAPSPTDASDTLVTFKLRGVCALLSEADLTKAFGVPVLPNRLSTCAGQAASEAA